MSRADSWDDAPTHHPPPAVRAAGPVPDDWDDDASSGEEEEEEDPHKLWEDANNRAPMPELVIAAATAPPAQALQPSMRILKRPSAPAASASAAPSSADTQRTLAERAAQYQAARQRIFGDAEGGGAATPSPPPPPRIATPQTMTQAAPAVKVLRNPRGPDSVPPDAPANEASGGGPPRGFRRRGQQNTPRNAPARGRGS